MWAITDELLAKIRKGVVRIHGELYSVSDAPIQEGDVVLDRHDGCYGVVEALKEGRCAVRDGWVSEGNVPAARLIRLEKLLSEHILAGKTGIDSESVTTAV
jgi:hypothetical protein